MNDVLSYYQGRRVLITGCSSGIGEALTQKLAGAGAEIVGVDRKQPTVEISRFLPTDLADAASIHQTVAQLEGPIWGIFNCAGLSGGAADRVTVLRVNFLGLRELLEGAIAHVPEGGAVVSTTSAAGQDYAINARRVIGLVRSKDFHEAESWIRENEGYINERGGYPLSKDALVLYTIDRCFDLGRRGIRINVVGPGVTDTPMLADSAKLYGDAILNATPEPLGRKATAEEQANILIYLNSDWASYINGQPIWSDGGAISRKVLTDL